MKITTEMTELAYEAAKDVFHGRSNRNDALDYLEKECGMNRGSANEYIGSFKKMMEGERYTRTYNTEATDYFLTKIYQDYGSGALGNALKAANEHVDYYESLGRGNLNSIRTVISRHEKILASSSGPDYPDEIEEPGKLLEGHKKKIFVNAYERNPVARGRCIEHYGAKCIVCAFDFEKNYGVIGKGFIHVHHLISVAALGAEYEVNPIEDLRPVCPNCHAMLHKKVPSLTIEELSEIAHNKRLQIDAAKPRD